MVEREVIHEHNGTDGSQSYGLIMGLIVIIGLAILFFVYGLPMLRGVGGTNVQIPDKVDVNVNGGQQ